MHRRHPTAPIFLVLSLMVPSIALAAPTRTPAPDTPTPTLDAGTATSEPAVAPTPIPDPTPPPASTPKPKVQTPPPTDPTPRAPASEPDPKLETKEPGKVPDPKSGDHLRPPKEKMLTGKHEVDLTTAHYKPGTGLVIQSKDGRFSLATRLRAQFRYTLAHDGEDKQTTHGIQIRRARLQFKGHVFNEHNKFKTEFALSPRDMGFDGNLLHRTPVLDWYFDFDYLRDFTVRIGQSKVPYSRQRVVSSGDLQLVDRTIANGEFNLDRDIGIDFRSKDFLGVDKLRYYVGVYGGEGRDQFETSNFEMFYLARVEVLPFGMFKDYKEADFARSLHPRLSLGAAYAFVDGGIGNRGTRGRIPSDGGTTDYHNVTADAVVKIAGFSFFTDVYYRQGKRKFGTATVVDDTGMETAADREISRNGLGWSASAGYLIPRIPFEIAARYAQVGNLRRLSSLSRRDEIGGGVSYYFAGHPMKLQADYFARFDESRTDQSNHEFRVQLQASF